MKKLADLIAHGYTVTSEFAIPGGFALSLERGTEARHLAFAQDGVTPIDGDTQTFVNELVATLEGNVPTPTALPVVQTDLQRAVEAVVSAPDFETAKANLAALIAGA
jgi:hypothetical protein